MENYLQKKHAEHYMGTDDEMPDAFDAWMLDLDVAEWIELSNDYCIKGTGTTETTLEEILDKFMIKWCGENAKHLIDSDDNDGERLRAKIKSFVALAVQQERERIIEIVKTGKDPFMFPDTEIRFIKAINQEEV